MKLLYAIDIRDEDLWRLNEVERWAEKLGATVDMVFVNPFGDYAPTTLDPALSRALKIGLDKARSADREVVARAMARLPQSMRGEIRLEAGDAAEAIADVGKDYDAIILSTRANTGLKRLWLGSVAERILRLHKGTSIVLHGRD